MRPFFPPGSNQPNHPNGAAQGSMTTTPQFPHNQAPPQFPMANFPNPNNLSMAMGMMNQNPQLGFNNQLGFNQAFQNLNALAAMQFLGAQMQQGQMQNYNFLGTGQLFANKLAQGFNQMVNNPMNNNNNISQGFNQMINNPMNNNNPQGFNQMVNNPMNNNNHNIAQGLNQMANNPILPPFVNMAQINHANGSTSGTSNTVQNHINNQNNISQPRFQNNQFSPPNNQNQFSGARGRGRGRGMQFGRNGTRGKMDSTISGPPIFPDKGKKRLPLIIYDPKEIKEWREARKRNFPTTNNIEKKLASRDKDEADLRRQQMKQVLEKQEELGFEAAEVPTHYLIGSKNKTRYDSNKNNHNPRFNNNNNHNNNNSNNQNSRFGNKRGRGRGGRGRNSNYNNNNYRNAPRNNNIITEPSLLKKLLGTEIKADKHRILHAFKFMVLNSFFEDEDLKFPEIRLNGEENYEENILEDLEENESSDERESEGEDEREEEDEKPEEGEITD